MNGEAVNQEAVKNEATVKKQFEKLKYSVKQLRRLTFDCLKVLAQRARRSV